jgi:hypothetical protein
MHTKVGHADRCSQRCRNMSPHIPLLVWRHQRHHGLNLPHTCHTFVPRNSGSKITLAPRFTIAPAPLPCASLKWWLVYEVHIQHSAKVRGNTADLSGDAHTLVNPIVRLPMPPDLDLKGGRLETWRAAVWRRSFFRPASRLGSYKVINTTQNSTP